MWFKQRPESTNDTESIHTGLHYQVQDDCNIRSADFQWACDRDLTFYASPVLQECLIRTGKRSSKCTTDQTYPWPRLKAWNQSTSLQGVAPMTSKRLNPRHECTDGSHSGHLAMNGGEDSQIHHLWLVFTVVCSSKECHADKNREQSPCNMPNMPLRIRRPAIGNLGGVGKIRQRRNSGGDFAPQWHTSREQETLLRIIDEV